MLDVTVDVALGGNGELVAHQLSELRAIALPIEVRPQERTDSIQGEGPVEVRDVSGDRNEDSLTRDGARDDALAFERCRARHSRWCITKPKRSQPTDRKSL